MYIASMRAFTPILATAPGLIVSTSGIGNGIFHEKLCEAADLILIHGNGCAPDIYEERVSALKRYGKPIVFNEDTGFSDDPRRVPDAAKKAATASRLVRHGGS
jgi:hypothetical protein